MQTGLTADLMRSNQISGFVLAGGASSRMGRDKTLLEIDGVPLLVRTANLLEPLVASVTVIGPPERYAALWPCVVPDHQAGQGPLGGIATALSISEYAWNLIVGCDMPYLTAAWLNYLIARAAASGADAVLPESVSGASTRPEPLCAMYHKRCQPAITAALARGVRKVTDGLAALVVEKVTPSEWKAFDSAGWLFKNINTPADYAEALARLGRKARA